MFIRLLSTTFVRCSENYGHIANIKNKSQNTFNKTGRVYLEQLSYDWQSIEELSAKIVDMLNLSREESNPMIDDLTIFIYNLEKLGYVETNSNKDILPNPIVSFIDTAYDLYENSIPQTLIFEITDACNERCIHCYISNTTKCQGNTITFREFVKIVDEFQLLGGKSVRLTGGEIFVHKDIKKMIKYCTQKGLSVELLSNLIAINDDDISFLKQNISYVQVSLYSINDAVHDSITTIRNSSTKTKINIEKLIKAGILVSIALPIMKANQHNVIEVLRYADERNIPVTIEPILLAQQNGDKCNLIQRLSIFEIEEVLRAIAEYDFEFYEYQFRRHITNDDDVNFDFLSYLRQPICEIGKTHMTISPAGDIIPCTGWRMNVIGNMDNSLSKAWMSKKMQELREIKECDFRQCVACADSDFCVRCMKRNDYENHDMMSINPMFCEVAHVIHTIYEQYKK